MGARDGVMDVVSVLQRGAECRFIFSCDSDRRADDDDDDDVARRDVGRRRRTTQDDATAEFSIALRCRTHRRTGSW